MNIIKLASAVEAWSAGQPAITVTPERCLHRRDKHSPCSACLDICPMNAITLDGEVALDLDSCIRCGLCLHECPVGVFEGENGTRRLLHCYTQLIDRERVEITCKHHPAPATGRGGIDAVISTNGCLSKLDPAAYLALFALGAKQVIVRLDACLNCPLGALCANITETIETARGFLGADAEALVVETEPAQKRKTRPVYSVNNPPVSRRGLFRMIAMQTENPIDALLGAEGEEGSALPETRRRLLAVLPHLPNSDPAATVADAGFTRLSADDHCNACELCARVCPTHALGFYLNDEAFALGFTPAACTNCGLCINLCEPKALQQAGQPTVGEILDDEPVMIYAGQVKRCRRCNTPFAGEGDLCPPCDFRQKNPFGLMMKKSPLADGKASS